MNEGNSEWDDFPAVHLTTPQLKAPQKLQFHKYLRDRFSQQLCSARKIDKCVPISERLNCKPGSSVKRKWPCQSENVPDERPMWDRCTAERVRHYLSSCQLIVAVNIAENSALLLPACTTQVQVAVDCHCWWRPYLSENIRFKHSRPRGGWKLKEKWWKFGLCRFLLKKSVLRTRLYSSFLKVSVSSQHMLRDVLG